MKPWLSQEFDALFQQIHISGAKVIALAGASKGCGSSTMTLWLAKRCTSGGKKTLIVDFDLSGSGQGYPKALWHPDGAGEENAKISIEPNIDLLPQSAQSTTLITFRQPEALHQALERWKRDYDFVICDAGTITHSNWRNLPASSIGSASDATILCIGSTQTNENELLTSIHKLEQSGAVLLGTVINDRNNPSLSAEITRVLNSKGTLIPHRLRKKISDWLNNNTVLRGDYV